MAVWLRGWVDAWLRKWVVSGGRSLRRRCDCLVRAASAVFRFRPRVRARRPSSSLSCFERVRLCGRMHSCVRKRRQSESARQSGYETKTSACVCMQVIAHDAPCGASPTRLLRFCDSRCGRAHKDRLLLYEQQASFKLERAYSVLMFHSTAHMQQMAWVVFLAVVVIDHTVLGHFTDDQVGGWVGGSVGRWVRWVGGSVGGWVACWVRRVVAYHRVPSRRYSGEGLLAWQGVAIAPSGSVSCGRRVDSHARPVTTATGAAAAALRIA
jgi:hypothetical protein